MTIHIRKQDPKTYVVLGMHQGGTSFISKALFNQGVDMGITEEGVYEDINFVNINDKILHVAGGNWSSPPPVEKIKGVAKTFDDKIKRAFKDKDFWGFKDPRTGCMADIYLPYLKDDAYLVCIFRKPRKVAESIARVGHFGEEKAYGLAIEYYNRIINTIRSFIHETA